MSCDKYLVQKYGVSVCINGRKDNLIYCTLTITGNKVCNGLFLCFICGNRICRHGCFIDVSKKSDRSRNTNKKDDESDGDESDDEKEINNDANSFGCCIECHFQIKTNKKLNEFYSRENLSDFKKYKDYIKCIVDVEKDNYEKFVNERRIEFNIKD